MNKTIKDLISDADALAYINALKSSITEIKEELATIEEMQEYQNNAIKRVKTIARRIDNQYRIIIKCGIDTPTELDQLEVVKPTIEELIENER